MDIEEEIWSPMYGLKGKVDVSVEVELIERVQVPAYKKGALPPRSISAGQGFGASITATTQPAPALRRPSGGTFGSKASAVEEITSKTVMPLEIKTGRSMNVMEHRAQTMLYTLMMSDRYSTPYFSRLRASSVTESG